jgi:uncharacterized protein YjbJ (UPF0337 family)
VAQGDSGDGESLEAAVKGIAMGLAGKLKEAAGELLEDPELEQQGVEQQREADEIRGTGAPAD